MAFSDRTRQQAYARAGGMCECAMSVCNHPLGRCFADLRYGWHAHHRHSVSAGGDDSLSNCIAMCIPCHERTRTYGRS